MSDVISTVFSLPPCVDFCACVCICICVYIIRSYFTNVLTSSNIFWLWTCLCKRSSISVITRFNSNLDIFNIIHPKNTKQTEQLWLDMNTHTHTQAHSERCIYTNKSGNPRKSYLIIFRFWRRPWDTLTLIRYKYILYKPQSILYINQHRTHMILDLQLLDLDVIFSRKKICVHYLKIHFICQHFKQK